MADYNEDAVDEMVLALLYLMSFQERGSIRAWKSHDGMRCRLQEKGLISDPKSQAKSILLSEEGRRKAEELFSAVLRYLEKTRTVELRVSDQRNITRPCS